MSKHKPPRVAFKREDAPKLETLTVSPPSSETLAGIELEANTRSNVDIETAMAHRQRLESHRYNVQRLLRMIEADIETYDDVIQTLRARAKETIGA